MEMVSCRKTLEPKRLLPTERAAFFHSLWVHHRVILWRELSNDERNSLQGVENLMKRCSYLS